MRAFALTLAGLLAAGQASAQSIQTVSGPVSANGSVVSLSCTHCPPKVKQAKTGYVVPQGDPGSDHTEIRQIDGKMKFVSTEAYRGGSPVVFITTADPDSVKAARADIPLPVPTPQTASVTPNPLDPSVVAHNPAIDTIAKTSGIALSSTAPDPGSRPFDPERFQLRLN